MIIKDTNFGIVEDSSFKLQLVLGGIIIAREGDICHDENVIARAQQRSAIKLSINVWDYALMTAAVELLGDNPTGPLPNYNVKVYPQGLSSRFWNKICLQGSNLRMVDGIKTF